MSVEHRFMHPTRVVPVSLHRFVSFEPEQTAGLAHIQPAFKFEQLQEHPAPQQVEHPTQTALQRTVVAYY